MTLSKESAKFIYNNARFEHDGYYTYHCQEHRNTMFICEKRLNYIVFFKISKRLLNRMLSINGVERSIPYTIPSLKLSVDEMDGISINNWELCATYFIDDLK